MKLKKRVTVDGLNILDHINAVVLMLVTPEKKHIEQVRKKLGGRLPKSTGIQNIKCENVTIDNLSIRYAKGGNPNGEILLLLSPLPQSILAFDLIWPVLESKYNLIAVDLPGFGNSEGSVEYMNFKAQGTFLNSFIEHFKLKNVHIVGPDVGMSAALYYAIHFEHKITSIIIGDGPGQLNGRLGSVLNKMKNSAFWRLIFKIAGAGAFVKSSEKLCYVRYTPSDEETYDYVKGYSGRIPAVLQWFKGYKSSLATIDPALETIEVPTKIFWGNDDVLLFKDQAENLHKRMKKTSLTVFEDCGHFSYQDQSEKFAQMIIDWVDSEYKTV